jgi:hypothetical protein
MWMFMDAPYGPDNGTGAQFNNTAVAGQMPMPESAVLQPNQVLTLAFCPAILGMRFWTGATVFLGFSSLGVLERRPPKARCQFSEYF